MHTTTAIPNMFPLEMPAKDDSAGYSRNDYNISYSDRLFRDKTGSVITNVTLKQASDILGKSGFRPPTAAEVVELAIKKGYKDNAFNDYSGNADDQCFREMTCTRLVKNTKYHDRYPDGHLHCYRDVYEGDEKVGELWVPEGGGRVVGDMSVFGVPIAMTSRNPKYQGNFDATFLFGANKDEVVIQIGCYVEGGHVYFDICALWSPDEQSKDVGLRAIGGRRQSYIKFR